jgi:hypothetical protein
VQERTERLQRTKRLQRQGLRSDFKLTEMYEERRHASDKLTLLPVFDLSKTTGRFRLASCAFVYVHSIVDARAIRATQTRVLASSLIHLLEFVRIAYASIPVSSNPTGLT